MSKVTNIYLKHYIQVANSLEIIHNIINPNCLVSFTKNRKKWSIYNATTPLNDSVARVVAGDKHLTKTLLASYNINFPKAINTNQFKKAVQFFKENREIVVKPNKGICGKGITILPKNISELKIAFEEANSYSKFVLLEEYVKGKDYRILVLGDKVIATAERIAAFVVGDGANNISQLIEIKNKQQIDHNLNKILIDKELKKNLADQNLDLNAIIKEQQQIFQPIYRRRNYRYDRPNTSKL